MKNLSIGMFDSGIGGLTVLKEVRDMLPHEHIVYLGDTARVPYGNRSPSTVSKYSMENSLFLMTKGVKILVIACNTSSALSLNIIQKKLPIPVVGVINAGAREAARLTGVKKVGVIGTRATVRSLAYEKAIRKIDPDIEVFSRSCPLFVPIVEEGLEKDRVAYLMAEKYLGELKRLNVDVIVMGCTHYPVLEPVIQEIMGKDVTIVHTGRETAKEVKSVLESRGLLRTRAKSMTEYYVTDAPQVFGRIGGRFLNETITRIKYLKSFNYSD